jgi:hypothetical protein
MDKNEAINNIKDTLKKMMAFTKALKFDDLKVQDGSTLSVEKGADVEVGTAIFKQDDQGNTVPCEDGDYVLEDGRTITVASGKISAIAEAPEDGDDSEESPVADANTQEAMDATAPVATDPDAADDADLGTRVGALEQQIAQILEILQGMSNMQEQAMSKINEFAASPAEPSIKEKKKPADAYQKARLVYNANKNEIDELRKLVKKSNGNGYNSFSVAQ